MRLESHFRRRLYIALALFLMVLPAVVFYFILWKNAVRIPILDDYDIVLVAANVMRQCHGFSPAFFYVLTAQHNGYKLIFENAIVVAQYSFLGQVVFLPLVALGNTFALLIFITVCAMFWASAEDLTKRLFLSGSGCLLVVPTSVCVRA